MDVSNETLCARLDELATAVSKGRDAILREFYMSIPARPDRDADLVLALAAKRIKEMERTIALMESESMDGRR